MPMGGAFLRFNLLKDVGSGVGPAPDRLGPTWTYLPQFAAGHQRKLDLIPHSALRNPRHNTLSGQFYEIVEFLTGEHDSG